MLNKVNLLICLSYGLISISQTLNSRFFFRTLGFHFYAFAFFTQRIANTLISKFVWGARFEYQHVLTILPYTVLMCSLNILSSYCVTVLPLAAFMAFKKFIVFFVLVVACVMRFPHNFNSLQYSCIFFIVVGGVLVGERDILSGDAIGYLAALGYNLCEAFTLEYQSYMKREKNFEPSHVFYMNSVLSIPYYLIIMTAQSEFGEIYQFLQNNTSIEFVASFALLMLFACLSEFIASYIAMKISPFEKATVSNVKDIVLTFISVYYFQDFIISIVSEVGIVLCLSASLTFSYTLLEKKPEKITGGQSPLKEPEAVQLTVQDLIERQLREAVQE